MREMLKGVLLGFEGEVLSIICEMSKAKATQKTNTAGRLYALWERQIGRGRSPARTASGQDGIVVVVVTRSLFATVAEVKSERIRIRTRAPCKGADIYFTGIAFGHTCNNITAIHQPRQSLHCAPR